MALSAIQRIERLQAPSHGPVFLALRVDQWSVKVVPGVENGKDGHGDDGRPRLGDDDMPENAQWTATVDPCRVVQLGRQAHEELAQQKDVRDMA